MTTRLKVKIIPNASRNQISGWYGDLLKIKVMSPPEDGKANKAVIQTLADFFKVPTSTIEITSGHTSQLKTIEFQQKIDLNLVG